MLCSHKKWYRKVEFFLNKESHIKPLIFCEAVYPIEFPMMMEMFSTFVAWYSSH